MIWKIITTFRNHFIRSCIMELYLPCFSLLPDVPWRMLSLALCAMYRHMLLHKLDSLPQERTLKMTINKSLVSDIIVRTTKMSHWFLNVNFYESKSGIWIKPISSNLNFKRREKITSTSFVKLDASSCRTCSFKSVIIFYFFLYIFFLYS